MKVSEIAADYLAHGSSAEEMALQFPHLSPSMIHSALAYYYDRRKQLETELTESLESSRLKSSAPAASWLGRFESMSVSLYMDVHDRKSITGDAQGAEDGG